VRVFTFSDLPRHGVVDAQAAGGIHEAA
jgi:hypothetical protein